MNGRVLQAIKDNELRKKAGEILQGALQEFEAMDGEYFAPEDALDLIAGKIGPFNPGE